MALHLSGALSGMTSLHLDLGSATRLLDAELASRLQALLVHSGDGAVLTKLLNTVIANNGGASYLATHAGLWKTRVQVHSVALPAACHCHEAVQRSPPTLIGGFKVPKRLALADPLLLWKGFIAAMMEYGAPFALWYAFCWSGSLLGLYLLLEWEVVSWQKSLRPFFESLGLDWYTERIDSSTGNLVIAFMVNELLEAVRFPLVLATSGTIIRWSARFRTAAKP
eukprot:g17531.t1